MVRTARPDRRGGAAPAAGRRCAGRGGAAGPQPGLVLGTRRRCRLSAAGGSAAACGGGAAPCCRDGVFGGDQRQPRPGQPTGSMSPTTGSGRDTVIPLSSTDRAWSSARAAVLTLRGLIGTAEADSARAVALCREAVLLETAAGDGYRVALGALGGALALDAQFGEAAEILSAAVATERPDRLELRRATADRRHVELEPARTRSRRRGRRPAPSGRPAGRRGRTPVGHRNGRAVHGDPADGPRASALPQRRRHHRPGRCWPRSYRWRTRRRG